MNWEEYKMFGKHFQRYGNDLVPQYTELPARKGNIMREPRWWGGYPYRYVRNVGQDAKE
jgi:hypothetical protein